MYFTFNKFCIQKINVCTRFSDKLSEGPRQKGISIMWSRSETSIDNKKHKKRHSRMLTGLLQKDSGRLSLYGKVYKRTAIAMRKDRSSCIQKDEGHTSVILALCCGSSASLSELQRIWGTFLVARLSTFHQTFVVASSSNFTSKD